ncbi:hypothetical protein ST201phi2-1p079 [Pseudomonas phage 201phi2-1]|uniref:Uncharacterized protein n=1 Tax=Pseudomonas phage 201phi2-1 TaxID=198110 RepID=B3FK54_BP201|nr:hypothetical protein ST201phi2-1p079 [Pseudomonas phage 201phi2-1]ABY62912.1 hypothetical protein 201phi2-1p079 [Pseudomonas phage 201phi2-1]
MSNTRNIGMLIHHGELDHILTSMSDSLRNAAYKVATEIAPKGSQKYDEYFDEDGTLRGYDVDTNKALLRDCLDHYVQFANCTTDRTDFNYYLETNFQLVQNYVNQRPEVISYLTSLFATACGILSSVLQPVIENIYSTGQMVDKIESFVTGPENTYYLVYGEDIDNVETYDAKEDDLSDVDVSQSPEELARLKVIEEQRRQQERDDAAEANYTKALHDLLGTNDEVCEALHNSKYLGPASATYRKHLSNPHNLTIADASLPAQPMGVNLVWQAPGM